MRLREFRLTFEQFIQGVNGRSGIAAADVQIMFELEGDGLRTEPLRQGTVVGPDVLDGAFPPARQHHYLLADLHDSAGDLSAEPAKIM